jgi:pimeloyl-ACP methyl ester carboxylesterase
MSKHPPVIIVHGIRTHAKWANNLVSELQRHGRTSERHDYGWYNLLRFLWPPSRRRQVNDFHEKYMQWKAVHDAAHSKRSSFRPDVIAHSFGTYIVCNALMRYRELKVGRIVLCGSILPRDFDWATLLARGQVLEVRNDCGAEDMPVNVVALGVSDAGRSGRDGFEFESPMVRNIRFPQHRHGDFLVPAHYQEWFKYLNAPRQQFDLIAAPSDPADWAKLARKTRAIDVLVYGGLPGYEEGAVPEGLSATWLQANGDLYTILIDSGGTVHGYVNAMPLTRTAFDEVMAGTLTDSHIEPRHIESYQDNTVHDLYLMSIAVHPASRTIGHGLEQLAVNMLLCGVTQRLVERKARGTLIGRVGAVAWTDEGERICRMLGMTETPPAPPVQTHPTFSVDLEALRGHPDAARTTPPFVRRLL